MPGIGGRKIDFVIIGALCFVVVFLAIKERIVPPPQESDRVPPTVSNYRRVTDSHVIFPPYASPYPLVSGNSRLYVSTIETSKILIKQVAMSGGDLESMLSPDTKFVDDISPDRRVAG